MELVTCLDQQSHGQNQEKIHLSFTALITFLPPGISSSRPSTPVWTAMTSLSWCRMKDRLRHPCRPLRVAGHAIWLDQCPSSVSEFSQWCFGRQIRLCLLKQRPDLLPLWHWACSARPGSTSMAPAEQAICEGEKMWVSHPHCVLPNLNWSREGGCGPGLADPRELQTAPEVPGVCELLTALQFYHCTSSPAHLKQAEVWVV